MTLVETRVFRPIDKLVHADPDYWPTFRLHSVRIFPHGKAKSKYARCVSLLDASAENPVCVVGQLEEVEEENLDRVLETYQENHEDLSLELPNVTKFCYGEQDRICKLWAEGEAGWFEIQPAKHYHDNYIRMIEAVTVWYFLEDQHNIRGVPNTRGRPRNPDVDTLFEVYLKKHREYETVETVEGVFHQSQSFLLSQMKKQDAEFAGEDEDDMGRMKWADTNIHNYFVDQSPDESRSSTDDTSSSSEEADNVQSATQLKSPLPQKRVKAGKSAKSAGLRPKGLTPKSARYKSARASSALAMALDADQEEGKGVEKDDKRREVIINEMKKAGARTGFLEAFLEGQNEGI